MRCEATDEDSSFESRSKKTTEFKYLLERKALRIMRRYYKESFEKMYKYKQRMREMTEVELENMISSFAKQELVSLESPLSPGLLNQVYHSLKIIILCDRYNKGEYVLKNLDFTLIRNVLNRYNTKNLTAFLSIAANSFLFIHFYNQFGDKSSKLQ